MPVIERWFNAPELVLWLPAVEIEEQLSLLAELAPDWLLVKVSVKGDKLYRLVLHAFRLLPGACIGTYSMSFLFQDIKDSVHYKREEKNISVSLTPDAVI